jgi:hypothetical protein
MTDYRLIGWFGGLAPSWAANPESLRRAPVDRSLLRLAYFASELHVFPLILEFVLSSFWVRFLALLLILKDLLNSFPRF